ncbi:MAG: hypothetical protein LKG27_06270 [Clostridiaceae bacterium]|jgi:predicted nucleotide-binding protein (sugar kinase/HSP70/actin superfamily)|nr:hypothetical protein [Clostridiaceae bacterium]
METTFTGYKNMSGITASLYNQGTGQKLLTKRFFNVEVFDDTTKDLANFQKAIGKSNEDYTNGYNSKFLNILSTVDDSNNINFELNGKPLTAETQNMGIFTYLAKLTERIINEKDLSKFRKDYHHIFSDEYTKGFCDKVTPDKNITQNYSFVNTTSNIEIIKESARNLNKLIQRKMEEFFQ